MIFSFENRLFVREEANGITCYEKISNRCAFYSGLQTEAFREITTAEQAGNFLREKEHLISREIVFRSPFKVNWLIEETCNLDCIYCFAHDKMHYSRTKRNIEQTAEQILRLEILNVGISGGEPTRNPFLPEVITALSGKCAVTLDTNGTLSRLGELCPLLAEADVLVRITLDSVHEETLHRLRPRKYGDGSQLAMIEKNIRILQSAGVPLMIHTVVTRLNITELRQTAEWLCMMGVKRWHLYGVNLCEKCKDIYEHIKASRNELYAEFRSLKQEYGNQLEISAYFDEETYSADAVLFIDSAGRYYTDSVTDGIRYIGKNPFRPTAEEIRNQLNIPLHCGYLRVSGEETALNSF